MNDGDARGIVIIATLFTLVVFAFGVAAVIEFF